jgi:formate dehydrogenase major subunit
VPGLGTSFGRGGATTFQQDLANSDCILIMGSNMAECHPVGFQWVMEAKAKGARVIHIDPRFTRTSAVADLHVPIRAGSDIVFLGALVRHILEGGHEFRDYVTAYTNAASIIDEGFLDTEDLDGFFSGWDDEAGAYDPATWQYQGAADADQAARHPDTTGAQGPDAEPWPPTDPTLEHPRCVFQLLKRHFARYTPDMVEEVCGVPAALFNQVADALTSNSNRERTSAICYAVGWTQHTVGVQYIRTAAIVQLLLGNVGRPGGGIMALRGHASIQGSTDIPTLYNILPGYLPMPTATDTDLTTYLDRQTGAADIPAYLVSLLKAWWGDAATAANDFGFGWLPRLTGDHSTYQTILAMLDGAVRGFFVVGENPAVGSANSRLHRLAMAKLDWLVVRDFSEIETASFWHDAPEIETGELSAETIPTEVFLLPAAAHTEKDGTFTNTQRMLQWHHKAVDPVGDVRSDLWFYFHLGSIIRDKLAASTDPKDEAVRRLAWDYPVEGRHDEPSADAVLREINGSVDTFADLRADGTTSCGCWIYCGCYAGGVNQTARRKPGQDQNWVAPDWGWAWPANRRILYNRASADPDGVPWSERKRYVWWDDEAGEWTGFDVPDCRRDDKDADAFIMQVDGKGWLFAPNGLKDGPLPAHFEPEESPFANAVYAQQSNPVRQRPESSYHAVASDRFPYVMTTYRLTEHHTAGGMSRFVDVLSELQPEFFCEVSPELAAERGLEHGGWATIISTRTAIEARVLVTDRIPPLRVGGRVMHQVGLPYHWGQRGLSTGDSANDLFPLALDPNVHIQEVKAATCDIRPGRRPRGPALLALVEEHRNG